MYLLKKNLKLKEINGKVISGKKVIYVNGNKENMQMMEEVLEEIATFVSKPLPPKPKKISFCKKCGYRDYCF